MEHQKTPGERDRGASREDGKQSHPLSPQSCQHSGRVGGVARERVGKIGCLCPLSMLQSSFLVSWFMRRLWHHA